jgi:hypothetical protein
MTSAALEFVSTTVPLAPAIADAFARLRESRQTETALVFDMSWHPTMDVVELIARELVASGGIQLLTLIHPSAAMSVIAAAIATRVESVSVTSKRSMYDEDEIEDIDPTESKTLFSMDPGESLNGFVRRSVREARNRAVVRVALVFHKSSQPTMALADTLVEELVQSGVRELGLIHATTSLDAIAASVRLRLANVRIALGSERTDRSARRE